VDFQLYRAFENRFRGSEKLISARLQQYENFFIPIASSHPGGSIFDAGCGRGEWINLMLRNGFNCIGVDENPYMINDKDLPIRRGNALEAIKHLPEESQSIISAFHFVEHLSSESIISFIKDSFKALKSGGILIMEIPNIENIEVASSNFWLDPSHLRPIPASFLAFLVQEQGFFRYKILRLQEENDLHRLDRQLTLSDVFFGVSPDVAVVAQKGPGDQPSVKELDEAFKKDYGLSLRDLVNRYDKQIDGGSLWRIKLNVAKAMKAMLKNIARIKSII
jgi:O-antigen chain-terminating methyltransferase